ncbi:MAG: hypothetical protein A3B38_00470 [Candidatus Levybacteria bacterium RIFCSPLOWO2_01_FULL_36_13]|nr:MAG: hypothetical protein A2684_01710 [Candidatus Levybacteria bacterium RIFCSPHIGHO2_01_FULL_36_15b]OGH35361.1 MAG: hypothetical protein A3B38_00470 [Candidatus Levybacteria bacterium RIFCSPLOWO2_01_FULL_36_13]
MDPNLSKKTDNATSHVIVPSPLEPTASSSDSTSTSSLDPQREINAALAENTPNPNTPPIQQPQEGQSLFSQMNSPQTGTLPHQMPPEEPSGRKINKKLALGILIVLAIVALPTTVYLTQQQQTVQQQAAPTATGDKIVAVYNGENITRAQVQALAEERYPTNEIDNQALRDAMDTLLERKILDKEASIKNINLSEEEIQAKVENDGFSETEARYSVLREKVTELNTKNWQVYTIGFWTPTATNSELTAEEKTQRTAILSMGKTMINEAKTRLENDESAFSIAKSLLSKYSNFQGTLAVNGFQLAPNSEATPEMENPKTYVYELKAVGQPLYDTIYSLQNEGEVKLNNPLDGSGADAVKLVGKNNSNFNTYEDWLKDKKSTAVINGL